jgi:hypothetical protein
MFVLAATVLMFAHGLDARDADLAALKSVHADELVSAIDHCVVDKIAKHTVRGKELGNSEIAANFGAASYNACGYAAGKKKLEMRLKQAYPNATSADVQRQIQRAFALGGWRYLAALTHKFRLDFSKPLGPTRMTVDVPACPPSNQPQPNSCPDR